MLTRSRKEGEIHEFTAQMESVSEEADRDETRTLAETEFLQIVGERAALVAASRDPMENPKAAAGT